MNSTKDRNEFVKLQVTTQKQSECLCFSRLLSSYIIGKAFYNKKGKNVKNTVKENDVSFFDAIKYAEINNIVYYRVDVPEIAAVYYFSINPVEKEVSYFVTNDFTKPIKTIGLKNGEKTAFEIVGDIPGIHSKVAALLFLKAAYHLLKKKDIPENISYCR